MDTWAVALYCQAADPLADPRVLHAGPFGSQGFPTAQTRVLTWAQPYK